MIRKTKQSVKKYPVLFLVLLSGLLALGFDAWNKDGLATGLLLLASIIALVPAFINMNRTFKSGYFGINVLPVTALVTAVLLQEGWTALVLALILVGEKPLIAWLRGGQSELLSASHTSFARLLDQFSVPFSVMVLLFGGALWVVTGEAGRFLEIIAVASPAPLILAVPLTFMTGLQLARTYPAYIRSANMLERLANIGSIIFTKNGVLTENQPALAAVKTYGDNTKEGVLHVAAALVGQSSHPLAKAIIIAAQSEGGVTKAKHAKEVAGMGIVGRQKGQTLLIGRYELLEAEGVNLPVKLAEPSKTTVYVAKNDELIGSISFDDANRELTDRLAGRLRKLGIRSVMIASSDVEKAVETMASHTGIGTYQSRLLAADKIRLVETSATKPVAFVGHAETDTAALTAAELAITYGEHLQGVSDISIEDESIGTLLGVMGAARRTIRQARLVSLTGLIVTLALTAIAASGAFSPLQSAGLQAMVFFLTVSGATYVRLQTAKQ